MQTHRQAAFLVRTSSEQRFHSAHACHSSGQFDFFSTLPRSRTGTARTPVRDLTQPSFRFWWLRASRSPVATVAGPMGEAQAVEALRSRRRWEGVMVLSAAGLESLRAEFRNGDSDRTVPPGAFAREAATAAQTGEISSSGFSFTLAPLGFFRLCDFPAVSVGIYLAGNKVLSGRVDGMRRGT